ncbi:hypothetical protein EAH89_26295 [Roseomonas nepalensis]|uniref:Uncharacterized protein n=1 Tax=Muricoccus nepalensis TaxID=1854500 RepID=A0A502F8T0_9PROT|nr:hypothetical protein [Roseomonas nepalensis]TPG45713.1 hypothetical protein EAH89_26295 [Roseomonas nepalensis]
MVKTWGTSAPTEEKCSQCGSCYEVRQVKTPVRDKDSFNCVVCRYEMDSWNDTTYPTYRLIKREPWPRQAD